MSMVGRTLVIQGRLAEGGELLRQALGVRERIYGKQRTDLIEEYDRLHRPELAGKYRADWREPRRLRGRPAPLGIKP